MSTSQWSSTNSLTTKASYAPNIEEAVLASTYTPQNSQQGYSISITADKSRVIVGAPFESNHGAAYIFYKSGSSWILEGTMYNSDYGSKMFGASVDIDATGTRCIIGAPTAYYYYNGQSYNTVGCAYIYIRTGTSWNLEFGLYPHHYNPYETKAGFSVSITNNGDIAIMGAPYDNGGVAGCGSVYIYTRTSSWSPEPIRIYGSNTSSSRFGSSVSIASDGSRLIVGEDRNSQNGYTSAGKTYIFKNNSGSWIQEAVLTPSDRANGDYFGCSVDIDATGTRCIIGASQAGLSYQKGKAYIFTRSGTTWTQEAKLIASNGNYDDYFGWSVAITGAGDRAVIGAPYCDSTYQNSGRVYVFGRSGTNWSQQGIITGSNGYMTSTDAYFGYSVGISNDGLKIVAGAINSDASGYTNGGAGYIFT